MICPHCKKDLTLNNPVLYNVERYQSTVMAVALCCGRGVRVIPKMSFEVIKYMGKENHDDWGHAIKPKAIPFLASSVL